MRWEVIISLFIDGQNMVRRAHCGNFVAHWCINRFSNSSWQFTAWCTSWSTSSWELWWDCPITGWVSGRGWATSSSNRDNHHSWSTSSWEECWDCSIPLWVSGRGWARSSTSRDYLHSWSTSSWEDCWDRPLPHWVSWGCWPRSSTSRDYLNSWGTSNDLTEKNVETVLSQP
jgi:hypothetical protein